MYILLVNYVSYGENHFLCYHQRKLKPFYSFIIEC